MLMKHVGMGNTDAVWELRKGVQAKLNPTSLEFTKRVQTKLNPTKPASVGALCRSHSH